MEMKSTEQQMLQNGQGKLLAFVQALIGGVVGREDDNNPLPPGPADPVIRRALERAGLYSPFTPVRAEFGVRADLWKLVLASIAAKHPEIWDVLGAGGGLADMVALNPQPLPPRYAFMATVAQTLIQRAEMIQDVSGAMINEGDQQGIIIVSGYINRLVDEFCGTGYRLRFPVPGPRPKWFAEEMSGVDLVIMAAEFDHAAKDSYNPQFGRVLAEASARLAEAGLARL